MQSAPESTQAEQDALLLRDLRDAWPNDGFSLAYQPQINLRTGRVTGFEALLRWTHPTRGDVPPASFIPPAEQAGLAVDIGRWVLERACRDAATWPEPVTIAVNLSATQLSNDDLPNDIAAALRDSNLPPSRLELEITETAALPADTRRLGVLHTIHRTGVRIVMDDFDVGYASLAHLLHVPITKIKLASAFIDAIPRDQRAHATARAIIRAIADLCRSLDITLLAEGVETQEQCALLSAIGCTEIQGYLTGRPLPAATIPDVLQATPDLFRQIGAARFNAGQLADPPTQNPALNPPIEPIEFFQIAESVNDIILVTTTDLEYPGPTILYVNPAFTRLTGYTKAEAIGQSPRLLQGPGTDRATRETIRDCLRAGRPIREKILNFAKSGAPYWLDLHIIPLRNASGAITHFAAIQRDVTMDKRRLDELEYLVDRDTLTGIPNRRAFLRAAEDAIEHERTRLAAASGGKTPCFAFIDADDFKSINDRLGHAAGDAVICALAECLTENVRRLDMLGRIGGDEFAVCMPAVTMPEARALAERLRRAVAATQMATPLGPVSITVSIGLACLRRNDTIATITSRADAAMYAAKRAGRNRVRSQASTAA